MVQRISTIHRDIARVIECTLLKDGEEKNKIQKKKVLVALNFYILLSGFLFLFLFYFFTLFSHFSPFPLCAFSFLFRSTSIYTCLLPRMCTILY